MIVINADIYEYQEYIGAVVVWRLMEACPDVPEIFKCMYLKTL